MCFPRSHDPSHQPGIGVVPPLRAVWITGAPAPSSPCCFSLLNGDRASPSVLARPHTRFFPRFDILHSLKGEDSYGSHAYARIPSVGACHAGLTSAEVCEQANKASPASLIFTAATKSALAVKPHWTHENFSCVLRFSAVTVPHAGHLRLVFCGGTATSNPPRHVSL